MTKFFSLLYQGDVHPAKKNKVVPAAEFSTLMEASQILDKAREDAEERQRQSQREAEEAHAAAKEAGFQEGLQQFTQKLAWFENELKTLRLELQQQILPIALKAARKIVAKELELHPETIMDIVLQALGPVRQNKQIAILIAKEDRERLEAEKPRLKQLLEQVESFSMVDRADISPGGCMIETETGIINATFENQWRALEIAFERYIKP